MCSFFGLSIIRDLIFPFHPTAIRPPPASRRPLVALGGAAAADRLEGGGAELGGQGEGFEGGFGEGGGPPDADQEELAARLAEGVADQEQVEPVAAEEDAEPQVEVPLDVEGASALEAEGVAGELDRREPGPAVL